MMDEIFVTKPYLPPLEDFTPYLQEIWDSGILSNCGPFHTEFERQLADYLGVPHISLFNNGTIALVTALQAMGNDGEVITTPFSFVATSHAIMWNRQTPVFVDIEPDSMNLDPDQVEAAITPNTRAIVPVHCYGNVARVADFEDIARRHGLKLIYDAAHAFGVEDAQGSVLNHGDLSTLSLHATKVFNTFEGGAIICKTAEMKDMIDKLKNFGHEGETSVVATGINGKMSEINAAFGLLQLKHIDGIIDRRAEISARYRAAIDAIHGLDYLAPALGGQRPNHAYFPVLVRPDYHMSRDELYHWMKSNGVHPRRYFYPLITEFDMYKGLPSADPANLPIATSMADQVLCLPIYPDLTEADLSRIIDLLQPK
ncbi:DegT/DnrJ/EryC1/StrS family aminotransferase [Sedimentitalea todarodis]|uniref:DegT/DnrJ/EryC1/StrS family aminotransferase n=1 Tax=Sedimentitalea todarodis TaxID=1631240 RepID=A0ABU3VAE1_9RHOB|nr:DegT/DnrJ/EryC1/StrS family aminotransferase [Sedimentitalea todarodis]MDU9002729.1 DegT/DnrJ/EryC1/StrS family aminotransferase [Sedimentitalea todarodis]